MSEYQDQYQKQTPTNYHNATSVASRDDLDRTKKSHRYKKAIFDHICIHGTHGATCDEIEQRLGLLHQTASCYITCLTREGQIQASGQTRAARSGRQVTVWTRKFRPAAPVPAKEQPDLFQVKPTYRTEVF